MAVAFGNVEVGHKLGNGRGGSGFSRGFHVVVRWRKKKRRPGNPGRPLGRRLFARVGFRSRELFEDERMGLVGDLGDEREVISAEAVGVVELLLFVLVSPRDGYVVEGFLVGFVRPHGGFDWAEAKGLHRTFGIGRSGRGLRGDGSGWRFHLSSFF